MKYLYEKDGVVKAYPEKKPKGVDYAFEYNCHARYKKALKEWKASGVEVENTGYRYFGSRTGTEGESSFYYKNNKGKAIKIIPGQQVEIEITENGCKVESLI